MLDPSAKNSQSSATLFKTDLPFGFLQIATKTENSFHILKDLHDFFNKRADFELHYGKQLMEWSKTLPGSTVFFGLGKKEPAIQKEGTSLQKGWNQLQTSEGKIGEAHLQFAKTLHSKIVTPIIEWLKIHENERKNLISEGQKYHRKWVDLKSTLGRLKLEYEKAMKLLDTDRDHLERLEKDDAPTSKKKYEHQLQKHKQTEKKGEMTQRTYEDSVNKLNDYYQQLKLKLYPELLDKLQTWEEKRWNLLRGLLDTYRMAMAELPQILNTEINSLETQIENALIDDDFKEFVQSAKQSMNDEYSPAEFTKYNSRYSNPPKEFQPENKKHENEKKTEEKKSEENKEENESEEKKSEENKEENEPEEKKSEENKEENEPEEKKSEENKEENEPEENEPEENKLEEKKENEDSEPDL